MNILLKLPNDKRKPYIMVDYDICANKLKLSAGAQSLYLKLLVLKDRGSLSDAYLAKAMDVSIRTIQRMKKELIEKDLIKVVQVAKEDYFTFLGSPQYPASVHASHRGKE